MVYLTASLVFFIAFAPSITADSANTLKPQIGSIEDSGRVNPEEFDFSNAEEKLWLDGHLLNIKKPARLHYEFHKTGSYEEGFTDDVYLDVIKFNEDNTRDTVLDFFSAERKQLVQPSNVNNVTGNPVIGVYMQGDVYEMSRLTSGHWKYFLKQLKLSMSDSHDSEAVTINFNGKEYKGEKITLLPFESAINRSRLGQFSDKRYEFTLSDEIPGKLYQIKTVINDKENPGEPLVAEALTLMDMILL